MSNYRRLLAQSSGSSEENQPLHICARPLNRSASLDAEREETQAIVRLTHRLYLGSFFRALALCCDYLVRRRRVVRGTNW